MATIEVSKTPQLTIDDAQISKWIGNRLNDARNRFIISMSGIGTGRTYRHSGKVWHRASQGWEYPKSDSGRLAGSVHTTIDDPRNGSIWSNLEYADILEQGSEHMAPRLMLGAALTEVLDQRPESDQLAAAAKVV